MRDHAVRLRGTVLLSACLLVVVASSQSLAALAATRALPHAVPGAPTAIRGVGGWQQVTVGWNSPSSNGGQKIRSYKATATPGGRFCTTSYTSCVITHLQTAVSYRVTVRATNNSGTGKPSAASPPLRPIPLILPGKAITYTTFAGAKVTLDPWVGRNVAVLTPPGSAFGFPTMTNVISALDASWDDYASIAGKLPTPYSPTTYKGRDTIAVVVTSCGAACSYIGYTGTEINPSYFQTLYDGVKFHQQYDQVQFYEFGRNFWFYDSQLGPNTTFGSTTTTGFAVLMRFQTMNDIGISGGPYNATPFPQFESQVWGLTGIYDAALSDTFANTLAVGNSPGMYGGTDFFASIVHLLSTHYGGRCFVKDLFASIATDPATSTDDGAVTNFVNSASHVAGVDLGPFFYGHWAFPRADGTTGARVAGGIASLPKPSAKRLCPA